MNLNDYSQRFAKILFEFFPEWKEFLTVQSRDNSDEEGYLLVRVPVPVKGLLPSSFLPADKDFLTVDSDGEITVGFDYFHTHFDEFSDADETESFNEAIEFIETESFNEAIEFIRSILDETRCPVVVLDGNQWGGSTYIGAGEKPSISGWKKLNPAADVYVRSWRGTYNRKYQVSELLGNEPS